MRLRMWHNSLILFCRLDTLLKDGSVSHKGADAIKVKLNIVRAFINTQGEVGDQAEAEPEIVRKSSGEL
jgi:protein disulfide-isomerase A6